MTRRIFLWAAIPVLFLFIVPVLAVATEPASKPTAATVVGAPPTGIDRTVFDAFMQAVTSPSACPGSRWQILAAIWQQETGLATFGGATVAVNGDVRPRIYGQPTPYGLAEGPGQFIPGSWGLFGVDGNGDGIKDPHNVYDAAPATLAHLCSSAGGDLSWPGAVRRAAWGYYGADVDGYADSVLGWLADFDRMPVGEGPGPGTPATSGLRDVAGARLAEPAASAWEAAVAAAARDGVVLVVVSSWRSSEEQAELRWKLGCPDLTSPSSTCKITPVAPVGESNHERGLAVDVEDGPGLEWMARNACRFGLVGLGRSPGECGPAAENDRWHYSVDGR